MTQYSDEDLLNAAAGLYGIVHVRQLTDILRRYGGSQRTRRQLADELAEGVPPHCAWKDGFLYCSDIDKTWEQWEEIIARSNHKAYYYPEPEAFLAYRDHRYIEHNASWQKLLAFIEGQNDQIQGAKLLDETALDLRQGKSPQQAMVHLLNAHLSFKEEQFKTFGSLFLCFYNDIRLYMNHGYTPEELKTQHFNKKKS